MANEEYPEEDGWVEHVIEYDAQEVAEAYADGLEAIYDTGAEGISVEFDEAAKKWKVIWYYNPCN